MLDVSRKCVLVTGAHGFLGHHVVKQLEGKCGALLTPTRFELDLMDQDLVYGWLDYHRPNIIIHLAAQCGGIGVNRERPGEFFYNNMMMSANIINAAEGVKSIEKFVGIGSVCMYPKYTPVPFSENNLYDGYPEETNAPYGLAKRGQLEMLKAYRKQFGFNGIFLIPVNMCGEWDNFDDDSSHVIPAMLKKFHRAKINNEEEVVLWGDGSASREFLYAGDCAEAIYLATTHYDGAEPVNIGTGREITIKDLAWKIRDVVGFPGNIFWDVSHPNGQPRRCLDVSRAKGAFGFKAKTPLDEMLERTYTWALENEEV